EPGTSLLSRWRGRSERLWHWDWLLRPGTLTAAISLVLALIALGFFRMSDPPGSPPEFIQRSVTAEKHFTRQPRQSLHRTYRLEETDLSSNRMLKQQRIEVWQRPTEANAGAIKVRRLYDENQRLIAGEWIKPDGSRTLYRRQTAPQQQATETGPLS